MKVRRGSGVLLHITSLPGRFGIGDVGPSAYEFIDFLKESCQQYWQVLPLGPVSRTFECSPYMCLSAFAGNSMLISPDMLLESGLLKEEDFGELPAFSEYTVEFDQVVSYKKNLLKKAYLRFRAGSGLKGFNEFCDQEKWLDDYGLFMALREENGLRAWYDWPRAIADRQPEAIAACRSRLAEDILYYKFVQFCFHDQWHAMRNYANKKGIALIGDIPIYVSLDSADVWAHQDCFRLHKKTLQPTHVAGVPPDYFSETGQRWGNPLYRWKLSGAKPNEKLISWWQERFQTIFRAVDIVRIDHFRGFESFWEIPAAEETAINGRWVKGPGRRFFKKMEKSIGTLPIIAEDLGVVTPAMEKLRDSLGFPGMKILQFAFDSDEKNLYLPHNFETTNCVVYTGTHDNDTTLGWYFSPDVAETSKTKAKRYANSDGSEICLDFIRMAMSSVADMAIIPMQDLLGFGTDCRMNKPSTTEGNWMWRCATENLSGDLCQWLRDETLFYNRMPELQVE